MPRLNCVFAPIILAAVVCQTALAAGPAKPGNPVVTSADKHRLHPNSKPDPSQNQPPPAGAILDLNGTPIPGNGNGTTFQQYSVTFVAALANTAITIALRDDPLFLSLEEVSVVDLAGGGNLLVNGDFSGGTYTNNGNTKTPVGWTYANLYGATAGGVVQAGCGGPQPAGYCWYDGAYTAYDALSQTIATTIGHSYKISFYLAENSGFSTFSRLSTNGTGANANGIDVLVYAQAGLPAPGTTATSVPTLSNSGLFLMALLLAAAGLVQMRRARLAP